MATVGEVMSTRLLTVEPGLGLIDAARQMNERNVGAVLVLEGEHVAGILTERDILHAVANGPVEGELVSAWMTRGPETIEPDDSAAHAASMMIHGGFRHLPVCDGGRPVGIVSIRDLIRVTVADETPRGA
jgi:CBS domain-containing protein